MYAAVKTAAGREHCAEVAISPLDYQGRRVMLMSTYETLMVVIGFVNCLLIVLIAWISGMRK